MQKKSKKSTFATIKDKSNQFVNYDYKMKVPGLLRLLFAVLIFISELILFSYLAFRISELGVSLIFGLQFLGLIFSVYLSQKPNQTSYTQFWIMMILFFPALGFLLYFFWGRDRRFPLKRKQFAESAERIAPYRKDALKAYKELDEEKLSQAGKRHLKYLATSGFPLYQNTDFSYFASGDAQFKQMFEDLRQAQHFIFMEYFIVADGYIWDKTVEILLEKAQQGLDIRLLVDDFGTTTKVDSEGMKKLLAADVKIITFNPVIRYASGLYINYRNHKKSCIIDGKIGWLGGTNLADEYANIYERFGYWKDTAIRLEGQACHSITQDFLLFWEQENIYPQDEDFSRFFPEMGSAHASAKAPQTGIAVPFWDGPLGREDNPVADILISLINMATESLIISTPYLVPEDAMLQALCNAAQSGVDVKIILPGIPDKPLVYKISQYNYGRLLEAGCRIFQYTPGFLHAKTFVADSEHAILGSVNLDYRSLYLNFENAVYIYRDKVIANIEQDMEVTLANCHEISLEEWHSRPLRHKIIQAIIKPFSPLL